MPLLRLLILDKLLQVFGVKQSALADLYGADFALVDKGIKLRSSDFKMFKSLFDRHQTIAHVLNYILFAAVCQDSFVFFIVLLSFRDNRDVVTNSEL